MQDPRIPLSENTLSIKPKKKKNPNQKASLQVQGNIVIGEEKTPLPLKPLKPRHKGSKRPIMTEASPSFQKPEGSNSDSLPDSSAGGSEYRQLRRKYLQLEDDGFALSKELKEAEDQVKTLEEEKIALLDQLVVMEGLVNPTEIHL